MSRPKALVFKLWGEWVVVLADGSFGGPFDSWRRAFDFAFRMTVGFREYREVRP